MSLIPRKIAILGPGLLGGSLLMALRERFPQSDLRAWARRDAAVAELQALNLTNCCSSNLAEVVREVELVVICTPVCSMAGLATELKKLGNLHPHAVITDVGSVKVTVVREVSQALEGSGYRFIGSHPMAGSEKVGLEAARRDLFVGQPCIVTPLAESDPEALHMVNEFWHTLGSNLLHMSPDEHDRKVARMSHLPHLMSAVVTLAALKEDSSAIECAGRGFRDTTRVAAGDPGLWTGITRENREEILSALRDAQLLLSELVANVENLDEVLLHQYLSNAKALRDLVPALA